jgi:hypothetical protein
MAALRSANDVTAPAMTQRRLGSHAPPVTSSNAVTLRGFVMPEMERPAPKRKPGTRKTATFKGATVAGGP